MQPSVNESVQRRSWSQPARKWLAQIRVNGRNVHLGEFRDETEAAWNYDAAAAAASASSLG